MDVNIIQKKKSGTIRVPKEIGHKKLQGVDIALKHNGKHEGILGFYSSGLGRVTSLLDATVSPFVKCDS